MSAAKAVRNTFWNLAGQIAPIIVALISIPGLISALGMERFGFLTLAWVLVGYLGVFDFGVGRAMTRVVAHLRGNDCLVKAEESARAALSFLFVVGLFLMCAFLIFAETLVGFLGIAPSLHSECVNALRILALSIPFVMLTASYRGYLEARYAFASVNILRIIMGVCTYILPWLVALVTPRLEYVIATVVAMRVIATIAHRYVCMRCEGSNLHFERVSIEKIKPMLTLGGWMTVSNVVSPLMGNLDRLLVGTLVAVSAMGAYATAFDIVSKVTVVAYAITGAMFPYFAAQTDPDTVAKKFNVTLKIMTFVLAPALVIVILNSEYFFAIWIGGDFANIAAPVMSILAVGYYFNCLAQVPAMIIHSRGNPKWMAVLHMIELPLFVGLIYSATKAWGVQGTAVAWVARVMVDALILEFVVFKFMKVDGGLGSRYLSYLIPGVILIFLVALDMAPLASFCLSIIIVLAFSMFYFSYVFLESERAEIFHLLRRRR